LRCALLVGSRPDPTQDDSDIIRMHPWQKNNSAFRNPKSAFVTFSFIFPAFLFNFPVGQTS
ncbi:MAG: hypothetical protein KDH84_07915, partial [Calditrichaeota bacterium]|nr:hypothetical protein [Calditrichota bacterium]